MPPRSTTSYALLELLALRSWTTHELAEQAQRSLRWFWPRAERKLYGEPKDLVAHGLASARAERTGKRPRTIYAITPQGRSEPALWLDSEPAARAGDFEAMTRSSSATAARSTSCARPWSAWRPRRWTACAQLGELAGATPIFPDRAHIGALTLRMHLEPSPP